MYRTVITDYLLNSSPVCEMGNMLMNQRVAQEVGVAPEEDVNANNKAGDIASTAENIDNSKAKKGEKRIFPQHMYGVRCKANLLHRLISKKRIFCRVLRVWAIPTTAACPTWSATR